MIFQRHAGRSLHPRNARQSAWPPILSKARCDDAEPDPVKAIPRISHIACKLTVLRRTAVQAEHQHAVLGLRVVERRFDPPEAGRARPGMASSNGRECFRSASDRASCTVSSTSQNHRSASGRAECSAWADATDTRRSLFVPPKRMVIRIAFSAGRCFRYSGMCRRCEPRISSFRDSPMCNRTSEVRATARPGMTLCRNPDPLDLPV